jgi:hypothetical protein
MSDARLLETQTAISADACGFLKADDDDERIREWSLCHALAARPRPMAAREIIGDVKLQIQWRELTEERIIYFGKARSAVLTKFEVTEETPPHLDRWRLWLTVMVTGRP